MPNRDIVPAGLSEQGFQSWLDTVDRNFALLSVRSFPGKYRITFGSNCRGARVVAPGISANFRLSLAPDDEYPLGHRALSSHIPLLDDPAPGCTFQVNTLSPQGDRMFTCETP